MFLIIDFFQPFCIFPMKTSPNRMISILVRKVKNRATIIVSWEIWPKQGSVYLERDNDTDRPQKSVCIYTFELRSYLNQRASLRDRCHLWIASWGINNTNFLRYHQPQGNPISCVDMSQTFWNITLSVGLTGTSI